MIYIPGQRLASYSGVIPSNRWLTLGSNPFLLLPNAGAVIPVSMKLTLTAVVTPLTVAVAVGTSISPGNYILGLNNPGNGGAGVYLFTPNDIAAAGAPFYPVSGGADWYLLGNDEAVNLSDAPYTIYYIRA